MNHNANIFEDRGWPEVHDPQDENHCSKVLQDSLLFSNEDDYTLALGKARTAV